MPMEEQGTSSLKKSEEQFEKQADVRNENRNIVEKLFRVGRESGVDVAQEEALRVDRLVDIKMAQEIDN